jgi:hypothetical protein
MTGSLLFACVGLLAAAGTAWADDGYKPGKWEFTVEMPDVQWPSGVVLPSGYKTRPGGGMTVVHTGCVTEDDLVPSFAPGPRGQLDPHCTIDKVEREGASVRWTTSCTFAQSTTRSEGEARYSGDTMAADFTAHITASNLPPRELTHHMTGRWLGPCETK